MSVFWFAKIRFQTEGMRVETSCKVQICFHFFSLSSPKLEFVKSFLSLFFSLSLFRFVSHFLNEPSPASFS